MASHRLFWRTVTQGDTGTPSVLEVTARRNGLVVTGQLLLRMKALDVAAPGRGAGWDAADNATLAGTSGYATLVKQHTSGKDLELASYAGAAAVGAITLTGVVKHGERVSILNAAGAGGKYEFRSDGEAASAGFTVIDLEAEADKAATTLTLDTQPTENDVIRLGDKAATFVTDGEHDGVSTISLGTNLATAQASVLAWLATHPDVTAGAFADNDSLITAKVGGTAANGLECFITSRGANAFADATLGATNAGTDCAAADGVTVLVTAINADAASAFRAADGTGDVVDLTAKAVGVDGNGYVVTETLGNGSATTQPAGGAEARPGAIRVTVTNATAEPVRVGAGAPEVGGMDVDFSTAVHEVTHAAGL